MSPAKSRRILLLLAGIWVSAWVPAVSAAEPPPNRLERYLQAVQRDLPPQAADALNRIEGTPRRLLAARAYIRAAGQLSSRWSWSDEQVDNYTRSEEHDALMAEVQAVQVRFERANPGYQLYANTEVRSLDQQLERWNTNPSIEAAAHAIHDSAVAELNTCSCSKEPDAASEHKFAQFLSQWTPPDALPLAAPGLSRHGQARAIDFQVMQDGDIVAGTEMSALAVWSERGWTRKLHHAVQGTRFKGPLAMPNEPWHYEYQP